MTTNPTVASVIARDLASYGARKCFALLGTANFKITHALVQAGVELISARHEGNAASMADAYAKATGELTLCSVHSGPGLTNALTGICEAAKSRTPLLVLAGDVATGNVRSNFHIEQAEMVRAVGAVAERVHTPQSARADTLRAATCALRERQTVVLSLPTDVQDAPVPSDCPPLRLPPAPGRLYPDPDAVRMLAELIACAKRPLVLAGRGAVVSDAEAALTTLAERIGALLATSVCGHGLFANNPWSLGISGGFSSPIADELISESDLILAFGASLTAWTTKKGKLIAPDATIAQIDIDAGKLGWHTPVQHAVLGDASATAEALLAELNRAGVKPTGRRSDATRARIRAGDNHNSPYRDVSTGQFIDPRTLSKAVDEILPKDRVVASDSGHFCGWVPRYLRVPNARASCLSHSFQSVGLGLASAIGLAVANPGKLAVLGTGDGGFLMSIADLETALRLNLRLCILIYNDSSYAAEVHYFRRKGYSIDIVQFPDTDFAAIARGYGARAATVRRLDDLTALRAWVREGANGVFIIDGKINRDLEADWHAEHFP
ncbi:MAG TPA: thiamine pyrophosphate-binding protein [Xanthobacteraceae bacterium]|nr:thiamine pyrophosphate-binding protein [Xanthobacteraceae bacterium]